MTGVPSQPAGASFCPQTETLTSTSLLFGLFWGILIELYGLRWGSDQIQQSLWLCTFFIYFAFAGDQTDRIMTDLSHWAEGKRAGAASGGLLLAVYFTYISNNYCNKIKMKGSFTAFASVLVIMAESTRLCNFKMQFKASTWRGIQEQSKLSDYQHEPLFFPLVFSLALQSIWWYHLMGCLVWSGASDMTSNTV